MSKKNIIIIFSTICLSALFYGCIDMMTFSLRLNEEKEYKLTCNGNQIEFQIKRNMGSNYQILITPKNGAFDFYPDSLIIIMPSRHEIYSSRFMYEKKEIFGHQIVEKGKTLTYFFSMGGDFGAPTPDPSQIFLIPPSNFIMCNGKPLVTDTIRVSLK